MMRMLIVEDDESLRTNVQNFLKGQGYAVDAATNGKQGLDMARQIPYEVILLDAVMPELDGISVLKTLKQERYPAHIMMVSGNTEDTHRLLGFSNGADDYLPKPFLLEELLFRLRLIQRRNSPAAFSKEDPNVLVAGDLSVDLLTFRVKRKEKIISLRPKEYEVLVYLMKNAGNVLSHQLIAQHVWNIDFDLDSTRVETQIKRLRAQLDGGFSESESIIETIPKRGYRLRV
jgi:two-component system, OmpR family, response regulator